ncbi:MAG TPA: right-handed parallel beta-helix repeat-containing protein, partial [Candidatus Saccharimonadales bacterium]|nr:right-handed parallel beta-helix repeat-containing protein [Candidatus Saccharimonadales bacterium]
SNLSVGLIQNSDATNGNDHITVRDLKLDGNKANQVSGTANGINFTKVGAGTTTVGAHILNIWAENFTDVGIKLSNGSRINVTGVSAHFNNNNGISLSGTSYSNVTGGNFSDNTNASATGIALTSSSTGNTISGNTATNNGSSGITVAGGSTANTVTGNIIMYSGSSGLSIANSDNNTFTSNVIKANGTSGIRLSGASNNLVDANLVDDNGQSNTSADAISIVNTSLTNTVSNNKLSDTAGTSRAIGVDATSLGNVLTANTIAAGSNGIWNSGGSLNDQATNTIYKNQIDSNGNNRNGSMKTSGFFQSSDSTNNADATIVSRVQGSATADLFQAQDSSGNALFKVSSTGSVTVGKSSTTGTIVMNSASGGTVTIASGATAAGSSYQLTLPTGIGTTGQCLAIASASGGIAQLGYATCGGGGGGGSYVTLQGTPPSTTDTGSFSISGTGNASSFLAATFDTSTATTLNVGTANATSIVIGTASNNMTFSSSTKEPTLNGTARHTRRIVLAPEYQGATMTGSGTNNTGTMTSDFCSASGRRNVNPTICPTAGDEHNYYSWTPTVASPAQSYDIYIRYQLPSDFSALASTTTLKMYGFRTGSNDSVTLSLYQANGTQCGSSTNVATGTATWTQTTITTSGCSLAANDIVVFKVSLSALSTSDFARAGEIQFDYLSKW